jgi:hypothetical protein
VRGPMPRRALGALTVVAAAGTVGAAAGTAAATRPRDPATPRVAPPPHTRVSGKDGGTKRSWASSLARTLKAALGGFKWLAANEVREGTRTEAQVPFAHGVNAGAAPVSNRCRGTSWAAVCSCRGRCREASSSLVFSKSGVLLLKQSMRGRERASDAREAKCVLSASRRRPPSVRAEAAAAAAAAASKLNPSISKAVPPPANQGGGVRVLSRSHFQANLTLDGQASVHDYDVAPPSRALRAVGDALHSVRWLEPRTCDLL